MRNRRKSLVRMGRLELPRPCGHWNLNLAAILRREYSCGSGDSRKVSAGVVLGQIGGRSPNSGSAAPAGVCGA